MRSKVDLRTIGLTEGVGISAWHTRRSAVHTEQ